MGRPALQTWRPLSRRTLDLIRRIANVRPSRSSRSGCWFSQRSLNPGFQGLRRSASGSMSGASQNGRDQSLYASQPDCQCHHGAERHYSVDLDDMVFNESKLELHCSNTYVDELGEVARRVTQTAQSALRMNLRAKSRQVAKSLRELVGLLRLSIPAQT